jgi:hypothetical protein
VLAAIRLDDQMMFGASEVDDKSGDRMLTTKLVSRQPPIAQREPQAPLGIGHCLA